MKKVVFYIIILASSLTSCNKKEYTCTCTATQTYTEDNSVSSWEEVKFEDKKLKKEEAENYCDKAEITQEMYDGGSGYFTTTRTCNLTQ